MKNPIGFIWPKDTSTQSPTEQLGNIEQEFKDMIHQLEMDEELAKKHLAIDEKVRSELIRIFRYVQQLEQKINTRNALLNRCKAYRNDFPQKSLELIDKIIKLDEDIVQEEEKLSKELSKHMLPDIAEIYKGIELSDESRKHIRTLSYTFSSKISNLISPIRHEFYSRTLDGMRSEILVTHPELR
jgi:hypothetical protein